MTYIPFAGGVPAKKAPLARKAPVTPDRASALTHLDESARQEMIRLSETMSIRKLADRYDCARATVWRFLKQNAPKKPKEAESLESKLQRMKHQRFMLNGVGWTVTINGFEIEGKEVRVLLKGEKREVKPRVYPLKSAAARLDEDFLKMTR
ncbi:helix-turn-helix domain-containing protein [Pontibacter sp. BT731]|uniref:helix-turn-helix domain-containing protein n=1 Tax=Pontibacter coccineus TaxID=3063328 RepID=UPI0026E2CECD|nr:helix-turn-helix domain-containing protein [Pontibacter sp. BT731]MDO6389037.1 helix-turn-helix domain-containing protein [Pontibacter sp. BT731]